ncbi:hypothetical protein [Ruegeria sp.]|uniref:hypothetical protein n=1 Tax=Ruegeria sp. TaxID=1879320 RepID=UPI00230C7263|nr:hypothetical protein [Ruegeria sp.]MDA7966195.1 hypothetical protein [Ruegeria sp.]
MDNDPKIITNQKCKQGSIIRDMFVDTADQNYVLARWCFQMGMPSDFLWNATHCLEKYLKAILLYNDRSAKEGGHNAHVLYSKVKEFADDLLPGSLVKPDQVEGQWTGEPADFYVHRIYRNGDASVRYNLFGYNLMGADLFKLDQVVFALRRMCGFLDSYLFGNVAGGKHSVTLREHLLSQPNYGGSLVATKLGAIISNKSENSLRHAALNCNFSFAPIDYPHDELSFGSSGKNASIGKYIIGPDEKGVVGQEARETAELAEWVLKNIHIGKKGEDPRKQLNEIRDNMRRRAKM